MFLAAQSMAVGTVMVRWVSKYSDPVMATGWVNSTAFIVSLLWHGSSYSSIGSKSFLVLFN